MKICPWLLRVYEKLPAYVGIIINHDIRVPYSAQTTAKNIPESWTENIHTDGEKKPLIFFFSKNQPGSQVTGGDWRSQSPASYSFLEGPLILRVEAFAILKMFRVLTGHVDDFHPFPGRCCRLHFAHNFLSGAGRYGGLWPLKWIFGRKKHVQRSTLPETNSLPLKIGPGPKRKFNLPTIDFQGRFVSFRKGNVK